MPNSAQDPSTHTQRRVNTITDTKEIYESYSFFVLLGKPSLCTQPKSTIIQISPGFRLSRRLCQIPPSYCTTENSFFFASHIDFSPFIQVEAVVNFYQIGFLPHKESPPGTFQPLSPSRGLATQLQHILSGLEFRLFLNKIFHIFLFFAEKFEIGRSSCLFQLF